VSVRFTADEVAQLRETADAQDVPLSAMIRRTVLEALVSRPPVAYLRSANQAGNVSGWAFYGSPFAKIDGGSTRRPEVPKATYSVPLIWPATPDSSALPTSSWFSNRGG
jgi:hypothetical protein